MRPCKNNDENAQWINKQQEVHDHRYYIEFQQVAAASKREIGCQRLFIFCWSILPLAILEASTMRQYGELGGGCISNVTVARTLLIA